MIARRRHSWLKLGVGILPEVDKGAVVLDGLRGEALCLVELAEPFVEASKGGIEYQGSESTSTMYYKSLCCDGTTYMPAENMMCALGVPGNISQGDLSDGLLVSPVEAVVAKGM